MYGNGGSRVRTVAAVDLGSSSLRVGLVRVSPSGIKLNEQFRLPNRPVLRDGTARWDIAGLSQAALAGLRRWTGEFTSVSVDSWSSDYVLLDPQSGAFVPPQHQRSAAMRPLSRAWDLAARHRIFRETGAQVQAYSARVQLGEALRRGDIPDPSTVVLVPDYISWLLTGEIVGERTNASTTTMLVGGAWDDELSAELSATGVALPGLVEPGTRLGRPRAELGLGNVEVVAGASHDTAAAVAAMPSESDNVAFVSCGTWHLVGVETVAPVLTDEVFESGLTNEYGAGGRNRLISVSPGLWMVDRCLASWGLTHGTDAAQQLIAAAMSAPVPQSVFDPRSDGLVDYLDRLTVRGREDPVQRPVILRTVFESLARVTAEVLERLETVAHTPIRRVHLLGGGGRIAGFAGLLADVCRRDVVAGPVEAATLGNAIVQAETLGLIPQGLGAGRRLVAAAADLRLHRPRSVSADPLPRVLGPGELQERASDL